jgi:iron complex outermembrane recepter protein
LYAIQSLPTRWTIAPADRAAVSLSVSAIILSPGGINRNGEVPYKPDYLTNYELGWKTTWANRFRLNGSLFLEK